MELGDTGFELGPTRLITVHQSPTPRGLRTPGPLNHDSVGRSFETCRRPTHSRFTARPSLSGILDSLPFQPREKVCAEESLLSAA
jgi:hypothetical protein